MVLLGPFNPPFPGKALILVAKLLNGYTSNLLADLLYFQWGSLGPLRMMGKLNLLCLACDEVILLNIVI